MIFHGGSCRWENIDNGTGTIFSVVGIWTRDHGAPRQKVVEDVRTDNSAKRVSSVVVGRARRQSKGV